MGRPRLGLRAIVAVAAVGVIEQLAFWGRVVAGHSLGAVSIAAWAALLETTTATAAADGL